MKKSRIASAGQLDLFVTHSYPAVDALIERRTEEAKADIRRMAESARRAIGQLGSFVWFRRRLPTRLARPIKR